MLSSLIALVGITVLVTGVALIYPPAALIVGGAALIRFAVMIDRPEEA